MRLPFSTRPSDRGTSLHSTICEMCVVLVAQCLLPGLCQAEETVLPSMQWSYTNTQSPTGKRVAFSLPALQVDLAQMLQQVWSPI